MNEFLPLGAYKILLWVQVNIPAIYKAGCHLYDAAQSSGQWLALATVTQRERSLMEQHIGTILQIMVVGLLAWSLNTSVAMQRDVGVLQSQIGALQSAVNQASADRYRTSDAVRDHNMLYNEIQRLDKRVTDTTESFIKHKAEVAGMSGVEYLPRKSGIKVERGMQ
jgi:hypothetical protein